LVFIISIFILVVLILTSWHVSRWPYERITAVFLIITGHTPSLLLIACTVLSSRRRVFSQVSRYAYFW